MNNYAEDIQLNRYVDNQLSSNEQCLAEIARATRQCFQFSNVLRTLVENMPESLVLTKLNLINKVLMTLLKWKIKLKRHKTPDEKGMLAAYSKPMDFTKKENIKELLEYVRLLG